MPCVSPSPARAELAALAAGARDGSLDAALIDLPSVPNPRPASVLMLFGVLDAVLSDHAAADGAVSRDLDVLLLSRAETLRSHPGQIAFPGGRQDAGDDGPVAAALREAREETGLDVSGVEVLGALPAVPLAYSRHVVTPVLAWWRSPSRVVAVDHAETVEVFRVPVAQLLDPETRFTSTITRMGHTFRGPAFDVDGTIVWGFTAMVLDALFDAAGWTVPWDATVERSVDL